MAYSVDEGGNGVHRVKLDPRLDFLLSLPQRDLEGLKRGEDAALHDLAGEIAAVREEIDRESGGEEAPDDAAERFERLQQRFFAPLTTGLFLPRDRGKPIPSREPYVSVFIRSDASAQDLNDLGAHVRSQACDLFTAFIPLSVIQRLEQSSTVHAIELARPLFPRLDFARTYTGIDTVQTGPPPVTGAGVIVGVIDTAFDVYHPGFRTAAGATRALFLWDQSLAPVGGESGPPTGIGLPGFMPAGGTFGVEYDQAAITAELAAAPPAYQTVRHGGTTDEHGTHVAGIAAGNGLGSLGGNFTGAAPSADIIFVSPRFNVPFTTGFADSTFVADAFSYIFARAAQLGKPCVVNMSLGDRQGAHDGSDLGERFLDARLTIPSRAITLAAGNDTGLGSHAAGMVPGGGTANLVLNYSAPPLGQTHRNDDLEIWYDGHDRFTVTVTGPMGAPNTVGPVAPGGNSTVVLSNGTQVRVTSVLGDPRNGDNLISVILTLPVGGALTGNWTIVLAGTTVLNGRFDGWIDVNNGGRGRWQAPFVQETALTISPPATARRPISVGNHEKVGPPPTIRASSSLGPTRDGRIKPEIATVGTNVMAPRSRNMNAVAPGALYVSMTGTSMAAPLVAGACAQLFECRGAAATWADLKQILTGRAVTAGIGAIPSNAFGFGFMRMTSACAQPATSVDVWLRDDAADTGIEPYTGPVVWLCPDIEVLDTAGNPVANPRHNPAARFNNRVRVTVRNRGTQPARNTEVFLYWADPATNIPFPAAWRSTGIYTGGAPNFTTQGNQIVVPLLAPGASTQVEFAWAPPAPGSNLSGDDHFCLQARLENEADPSGVGTGGFGSIGARNNIGLRNVHVQPNHTGAHAETGFYVVGSPNGDGLIITSDLAAGAVSVQLPVGLLPWRELALLEERGPRATYGCGDPKRDPLADERRKLAADEVERFTDIRGADGLLLADGVATVLGGPQAEIVAPCINITEGTRAPIRVTVADLDTDKERRFVHVAQLSAGARVGGFTLELRKGLRPDR
jgi:hypothetical protein